MKKLLILGAPFDYYQGGTEYQYKLLENYLKGKYKIFYLFRYPNKKKPLEKNYYTYDYLIRKNYNRYIFSDSLKIYRLIKKINPDLIYKRGLNYITAVGVLYAKNYKCDIIYHIAHSNDVDISKFQFSTNIFQKLYDRIISKYSINNVNKIIGQASYQDDMLRRHYRRKCDLVVPNFHVFPTEKINKNYPIKIVWIANIKEWKKPELFLEIAKNFENKENMDFLMIGRPSNNKLHDNIQKIINSLPNVSYKGELPIQEVNKILADSHIFVNTSKYEGFPNTFIQCWLRKVPVISLFVDPDNVIKRYNIGFHSQNFKQLLIDINKLVSNNRIREEMGERAYKYAVDKHSLKNIDKIIDLFN